MTSASIQRVSVCIYLTPRWNQICLPLRFGGRLNPQFYIRPPMTSIHAGVSRSPREHASVPRTKGTAVNE